MRKLSSAEVSLYDISRARTYKMYFEAGNIYLDVVLKFESPGFQEHFFKSKQGKERQPITGKRVYV
jgi:hypothetical protein